MENKTEEQTGQGRALDTEAVPIAAPLQAVTAPPAVEETMENIVEEITEAGYLQRANLLNSNSETWSDIGFWEVINGLILLLFYILILSTIIFAGYSVGITILEFFTKHDDKDTSILKISEHIFLSLLPIFIVLGFFQYYRNNAENSLITNNFPRNSDENSTKTMNLTKTLFLSSIISYLVIKIIEMIFYPPDNTPFDFWKILIAIILLTFLMIYYISLDITHKNK